MQPEVVQETMPPEEFEQAQDGGMVFKSEKEAKAAAAKFQKQFEKEQKQRQQETVELLKWFEEKDREDRLAAMTEEEREEFLEKERRRNLPENIMWRQIAWEALQNGAAKRRARERAERLAAKAEEARKKKIEDQLTMKPAE